MITKGQKQIAFVVDLTYFVRIIYFFFLKIQNMMNNLLKSFFFSDEHISDITIKMFN